MLYYLRGLANGRLAEMPLAEALAEPIRLDECGTPGALVDLVKLDDIAARPHRHADRRARCSPQVQRWAEPVRPGAGRRRWADNRDLARRALDVERVGVDNPRKDLGRWSDFRPVYGFFFTELFTPVADPADPRLGGLDPQLVRALAGDVADTYTEHTDAGAWFDQVRDAATRHGFAPDTRTYKQDPDAYPGSIREAANVVRVALTGSRRSPGLHEVARAIGAPDVQRRLRALAG